MATSLAGPTRGRCTLPASNGRWRPQQSPRVLLVPAHVRNTHARPPPLDARWRAALAARAVGCAVRARTDAGGGGRPGARRGARPDQQQQVRRVGGDQVQGRNRAPGIYLRLRPCRWDPGQCRLRLTAEAAPAACARCRDDARLHIRFLSVRQPRGLAITSAYTSTIGCPPGSQMQAQE